MSLSVYDAQGNKKIPGQSPFSVPRVASLAGISTYEGLEVVYQDANMTDDAAITGGTRFGGVEWPLRYRAAATSAFKWEAVGGGYLVHLQTNASNLGLVNGTWTDGGTPGPDFVCPLSGDYEYSVWAHFTPNGSTAVGNVAVGLTSVGGTPGVPHLTQAAIVNINSISVVLTGRINGLVAGTTYRVRYVGTMPGASVISVNTRQLMIRPVRVG